MHGGRPASQQFYRCRPVGSEVNLLVEWSNRLFIRQIPVTTTRRSAIAFRSTILFCRPRNDPCIVRGMTIMTKLHRAEFPGGRHASVLVLIDVEPGEYVSHSQFAMTQKG